MTDMLIELGETIPLPRRDLPDCELYVVYAYYVPNGRWHQPRDGTSAPTWDSESAARRFAEQLPRGWVSPFICKVVNPKGAIEEGSREAGLVDAART